MTVQQNYEVGLWQVPVYVRIGYGASESVHGPNEALTYLEDRWPAERGPHYDRAHQTCQLATIRKRPGELAREAFIAAAIEARIIA